jgi:hypothetical protein
VGGPLSEKVCNDLIGKQKLTIARKWRVKFMSKNSFKVNNSLHLASQGALPTGAENGDLAQYDNSIWARMQGVWKNLAAEFLDPMTTVGDIVYRDTNNVTNRLGVGSSGQFIGTDGTEIFWTDSSFTTDSILTGSTTSSPYDIEVLIDDDGNVLARDF